MYKWMYDRMVKEYEKESKEELVQRIMVMSDIELDDRCFANQCQAGMAIYNINELFEALEDLQSEFSYKKVARVYELSKLARNDWNYIRNGLANMNDDNRCPRALEGFKKRVKNVKEKNDSI